MRKRLDFYPTPMSIVTQVIERWSFDGNTVWEPCAGDKRIVKVLENQNCNVISTDIRKGDGEDFFNYSKPLAPVIITNPPFKYIRQFIDHAFNIGIEQMALVCPERLWACRKGRLQFDYFKPTRWANMDWREDYLQKGGSPDRALAVAMWDEPKAINCNYEIWRKQEE